MKEQYSDPEMEIFYLEEVDTITDSDNGDPTPGNIP